MPKPPRKQETKPPPPAPAGRLFTPLRVVALVVIVMAGAGLFAYLRGAGPVGTDQASDAPPPLSAATTPVTLADESAGPPANARFGPHKQSVLPPLPFGPAPPARPPDVVRAVYTFAAEHPEVLGYVPCYCGCERSGHRGNDDCFVTSRNANGDVRSWEPHGMTWGICIDVARDAMQMYSSGASVGNIRVANEQKWAGHFPNKTPTPGVPR